ncbi:MAG: hypothetical protein IJF75_06275 [Clostridia bacterium]|nr:hypothetical protein [Clostridia bacterium]
MKKNFLKITLSFVILICLLLTTACGNADDLQYRAGVFGGYRLSRTMIGIEGETDTFDIDNVNFKLFITLHQNDETPNKGMYISEGVGVFDFNFGLYVCDANDEIKDSTVSDYKNINGYKLLNEISEKEAFSGEYVHTYNYVTNKINYNHSEPLIIPKEVFKNETGRIVISFLVFSSNEETNGYNIVGGYSVHLYYTKNENIITIRYR